MQGVILWKKRLYSAASYCCMGVGYLHLQNVGESAITADCLIVWSIFNGVRGREEEEDVQKFQLNIPKIYESAIVEGNHITLPYTQHLQYIFINGI